RRKLQNRLNQRASMRKKELRKQQQEKSQFSKWIFYVDPRTEDGQPLDRKQHQWRLAQTQTESINAWEESTSDRGVFFRRLYELVSRHVAQHTLDSQLLLSVMQFNVIRAAGTNAAAIGIGMDAMAEDIISPFYAGELQLIPPNLHPTALQKLVIHHPWIDVCAQPSLRDALLRRLHNGLDEDEFCHHMFLQCGGSDKDGMIGMVVWGEAWDPASYEISATMVRKWPWIVNECPDIIRTTNYWRAKRQEGPLKI
ncbi:uncharacterized protein TRIVIDRAFT_130355, partial [Trichoderma virens Gv29-8]